MTALRLHGECPDCGAVERLRPGGTIVQHTRRRGDYYVSVRCEGSGASPVAGSVAAWLDAQDANARAGVDRAERAVAEAMAARDRAIAHRDEVTAWTAKQRAKGAEVSRG